MQTETVKVIGAANVTYSGLTYNTKVLLEYEHTGEMYCKRKNQHHHTSHIDLAEKWKGGYIKKPGYYFIKRIAIPTINADGKNDFWYINNSGDTYQVNKISKYLKKIHSLLSQNINPLSPCKK